IVLAVTNTDGVNVAKTLSYKIAEEDLGLGGTISYDGSDYEPGKQIPIKKEETIELSFTRKPDDGLKNAIPYNLTFTFDDENSTERVSVSIKPKVAISFVDFDATTTDEGVPKEITFDIACHDTDCSGYKIIYRVEPTKVGNFYEGGSILTKDGPGTPISFDSQGLFHKAISFTPHKKWRTTAPVQVIVKVVDSKGQTYQNRVSWTVNRRP
ncbi:MAG: hypothetical protein V6Z82_02685, partial [Flavobacteriales bacterium]